MVSPLDRRADFDAVRAFARDLAAVLQARDADRLTTEQRRDRRGHRIYLDTARNGYAQTVVAPYAVRASARAPIACPIGWDDLGRVEPQSFTLENAPRRLLRRRDPWEAIERDARPLAPARKALDAIVAK